MFGRVTAALAAAVLAGAGFAAAPSAEARTVVRVGIGVPVYPRPYRWRPYRGYYAPPPPVYYGPPPPIVVGGYYGPPRWYRPWHRRPYWRRW